MSYQEMPKVSTRTNDLTVAKVYAKSLAKSLGYTVQVWKEEKTTGTEYYVLTEEQAKPPQGSKYFDVTYEGLIKGS